MTPFSGGASLIRISSRSIELRSCRALPGQSCACSTAIASEPMARLLRLCMRAIWSRNSSTSGGTSSRRSLSGDKLQRHDRQPVEEVGAERARSRSAARRSASSTEMMRTSIGTATGAADAVELVLDQRAQQRRLRRRRQRRDFAEIERAAMRPLERADFGAQRAGLLARLAAEQHDLHFVGRIERAVDLDERRLGARAALVDQPRREALARCPTGRR